jgi:hypothetical protein
VENIFFSFYVTPNLNGNFFASFPAYFSLLQIVWLDISIPHTNILDPPHQHGSQIFLGTAYQNGEKYTK